MRRRTWTGDEIGLMWPRYLVEGPATLAAEMKRSQDSVTSMARKLRLQSLTRRQRQGKSRRLRNALARNWSRMESPSRDSTVQG